MKSLVAALKAAITTKTPAKALGKKGKRKGRKGATDADADEAAIRPVVIVEQPTSHWGLFEPIRFVMEPFVSLLRPFITSQVVMVVLFALLVYTWFLAPRAASGNVGFAGYSSPERIAAYEEIWRREESALWDWLEDRAGVSIAYGAPLDDRQRERQKAVHARQMGSKLVDERMTARQMDDAIRTTEERLAALKEAVERKKEKGG